MTVSNPAAITSENPVVARPYVVGLFDVLGFKSKFETLGLADITARYAALIDIVVKADERRAELSHFFPDQKEGPYWCRDGEIVIHIHVHAAYASDTFLVWSHYTWTDLHTKSDEELQVLSGDPRHDWLFHPVPCDAFLDTCNEFICRSLQVGLPVRGALAVGDAVLDKARNIFLGQPIIDAHALEVGQRFIGAGMCTSFMDQTIPERYRLAFNRQQKSSSTREASGFVLDWPRHWRQTRSWDVRPLINAMNKGDEFAEYYQHTLASVDASEQSTSGAISPGVCPIRSCYEPFSYAREGGIAAHAHAVRGRKR